MEESKNNLSNRKEKNIQKSDYHKIHKSNSQFFYKQISNSDYNNRISLNPTGEKGNHDIRYHYPSGHVNSSIEKSDYSKIAHNSFVKAEKELNIKQHIKNQKYQNLLAKDKELKNLCKEKNKEIKEEIDKRKENLKQSLTRIINDALLFSKKNNPVKSMLPENINEIVDKAKKETQDLSLSLNISNLSKISSITGTNKKPKKIEFLSLIGVDVDNMTYNHININIDKAWKFIKKLAKGRNIEEILRVKVVNAIMSMTEKKASEKARRIYEKLEIYKNYMNKKKEEERKKKQQEDEEKYKKLLKSNPKELIRQKMVKSLSQKKIFNKIEKIKKKDKRNKVFKKSESAVFAPGFKKVTRLNSYRDVNKIIRFIDESKKDSQSKLCKDHFMNIQMTKEMDINMKNILRKNEILIK